MSAPAERPIRLGVSACLLGEAVRYDGGHKRDPWLTDVLGKRVEWVPVCPELESGMGVPRPPMRLERQGRAVRLVEIASRRDHTARMRHLAVRRLRALRALCGYVLKKDSPSCGMTRVKLYGTHGPARREGTGLFAAALREAWPSLPVEEEGRLHDPALRETSSSACSRTSGCASSFVGRWTRGQVVAFHTAHKLQLMAHAPLVYASIGTSGWILGASEN